MVVDKGKKLKTDDNNDEENLEEIDGELVLSIEKLQGIEDELDKINEKASDEVLEVEKKYNVVRKPIYDKRDEIIKCIPNFWSTAFLNHPALRDLVTEEDEKIIKHLTSVEVEDYNDVKSGYSITFKFRPNPYFEDKKLSKTFSFLDFGVTKVTATSIKWKKGMDIVNRPDYVMPNGKRTHDEKSFFRWFREKISTSGINDEVAEIIKEDFWPSPLTYFNNECHVEEYSEDEDDDDNDDDDNDSFSDDEQEGDEDEEEE